MIPAQTQQLNEETLETKAYIPPKQECCRETDDPSKTQFISPVSITYNGLEHKRIMDSLNGTSKSPVINTSSAIRITSTIDKQNHRSSHSCHSISTPENHQLHPTQPTLFPNYVKGISPPPVKPISPNTQERLPSSLSSQSIHPSSSSHITPLPSSSSNELPLNLQSSPFDLRSIEPSHDFHQQNQPHHPKNKSGHPYSSKRGGRGKKHFTSTGCLVCMLKAFFSCHFLLVPNFTVFVQPYIPFTLDSLSLFSSGTGTYRYP